MQQSPSWETNQFSVSQEIPSILWHCQAHTVPDNVHKLHVQRTFHVWKIRGCQCSFMLLMMGGVSSETCWASYKYGIIKVWYIVASCWIFLYELYCDARIHDHQGYGHFFYHYFSKRKSKDTSLRLPWAMIADSLARYLKSFGETCVFHLQGIFYLTFKNRASYI